MRWNSSIAIAASVAIHAGGLFTLIALQSRAPVAPSRHDPIKISFIAVSPPPAIEPDQAREAPSEQATPKRRRAAPSAERSAQAGPPSVEQHPGPAIEQPDRSLPSSRGAVTRAPSKDDLLPQIEPPGPGEQEPRLPGRQAEAGPALRPSGGGTFEHKDPSFYAEIDRDGTVTFDDRSNVKLLDGAPLTFDVTSALMAMVGDDAARYDKSKFLAETRSMREEMCDRARAEDRREALLDLSVRLKKTWRDQHLVATDRRRILFELWDECAEGDEGAVARAAVVGFIRRELPAGSEQAYPSEEILALNERRRSKDAFDPYQRP